MRRKKRNNRSSRKTHKELVARRHARKEQQQKREEAAEKQKLYNTYAENSKVFPLPSTIEALANQNIMYNENFLPIKNKILNWFDTQIDEVAQKSKKINYLPDEVLSFVIPLDFFLPLPKSYTSGAIYHEGNNIIAANCVANIPKIIPVGNSAIKITYLIISLCDNETTRLLNLKTKRSLTKCFEKAIMYGNQVISSYQAIPSRHNHYIHKITSFSSPGKLEYFVFNRKNKKTLYKETKNIRDNVFGEVFNCRPLEQDELNYYKNYHVRKIFSNDKIFDLVSTINKAVNYRCFGFNDDAILLADKFVEYALGYLYCEIRITRGEDRTNVYEDYAKLDEKKIFSRLWKLLGYPSKKSFENVIGFQKWYDDCRTKRNELTHRFVTKNFNGVESEEAVFSACEIIRKTCNAIINKEPNIPRHFAEKIVFLENSTRLFRDMHKYSESRREKFHSRSDKGR